MGTERQIEAFGHLVTQTADQGLRAKFQGQAPVCLVAMATSGAEELARDLAFC